MTHPIHQFLQWQAEGRERPDILEPTAMSLATASAKGTPSLRIVLLKEADERGFVFYTNQNSQKGRNLLENPQAEICFHWMPLQRQFRAGGRVEAVSEAESDAYFASRARISQIGAWASHQSSPLESRDALMARVVAYEKQFEGRDIPRPDYWHGWRLVPDFYEFWQEADYRLHRRERYLLQADGSFTHTLLNP